MAERSPPNGWPLAQTVAASLRLVRIKTIKIWDVATGRETLVIRGSKGSTTCVAFSPDGRLVASGDDEPIIRFHDAVSGRETLTIRGQQRVNRLVYSPDGRRLASVGGGRVLIWDAATGKESLVLHPDRNGGGSNLSMVQDSTTGKQGIAWRGDIGHIIGAAFSPDGRRLALVTIAGGIRLFDTMAGKQVQSLPGVGEPYFRIWRFVHSFGFQPTKWPNGWLSGGQSADDQGPRCKPRCMKCSLPFEGIRLT